MMERRASTWVEATRAIVTAVESKDITLLTVRTRKEATETVDKEDPWALWSSLSKISKSCELLSSAFRS
jgi:hypothetical protein